MFDPGHHFEQFAGDVDRRADAARSIADLAGIGLHVADELGDGLRRKRWIDLHDERVADDARDRRDVADEVEIELVVEGGVDRIRRRDEQQRIAIRRRTDGGFGGDIGGCARPVFDDKLLAEPLGQPLTDETRSNVGGAAGGKPDHQAHRPRRVGLRLCDARYERQRGGAYRQMQEFAAGKFHADQAEQGFGKDMTRSS